MTLASHLYLTLIAFGIQRRKSIVTGSSSHHKGGDNKMTLLRSLCEPCPAHTYAFFLSLQDQVNHTELGVGVGHCSVSPENSWGTSWCLHCICVNRGLPACCSGLCYLQLFTLSFEWACAVCRRLTFLFFPENQNLYLLF